ncbi:MAG TPA: glycosyltransferase, partial [Candidatus Binataceae bacterium]|nr:glycosyltransferase [Candidatus Binataceae bacterium]
YADNPTANRWHRLCRGVLPMDDIARLYSSAKIVLNYHEDSQREWGMWNNRVFEALACGALLITDDAEGLAEEFRDGLAPTQGGADTRRLIEHYLAHPEERARIGAAGRAIVRRRYIYEHWLAPVRDFCTRVVADARQSRNHDALPANERLPNRPDFSIVIPVYNRMLGLREAVESALAQTYRNFELIIADDGSDSPDVQEFLDLCRRDSRISVLRLPHRGPGAALNAAARGARGEYLCRLDSDDMLSNDALETLRGYIAREPDVSYFYSSRLVIDEAGEVMESHHRSRPFDLQALAERFICNHLICIRRRDFLAVNGFREEIRFGEDYDLALRMAARFRFRNVDEFLYKLRYHRAGNITNGLSAAERDFWLREIASSSGAALRSIVDDAGEKCA